MLAMEQEEFNKIILKLGSTKGTKFKINNSNGTKEAWRWLNKNKWFGLQDKVSEHDFGVIIKTINSSLRDQFLDGHTIKLPYDMGKIEQAKFKVVYKRDKDTHPIDWNSTLKLWNEDSECMNDKLLVKYNVDYMYKIIYNKSKSKYKNKCYYRFTPARSFKKEYIKRVLDGLDTCYELH